MGATDAQRRANLKYLSKQARINLTLPPETKDEFTQAAEQAGQSLTAYILQAVTDRIKRESDIS